MHETKAKAGGGRGNFLGSFFASGSGHSREVIPCFFAALGAFALFQVCTCDPAMEQVAALRQN